MPILKKFICTGFNPDVGPDCPCVIIHNEDPIVDIVVYHEVQEHNESDTPELRDRIVKHLVNV
jgi:hypothetical protein